MKHLLTFAIVLATISHATDAAATRCGDGVQCSFEVGRTTLRFDWNALEHRYGAERDGGWGVPRTGVPRPRCIVSTPSLSMLSSGLLDVTLVHSTSFQGFLENQADILNREAFRLYGTYTMKDSAPANGLSVLWIPAIGELAQLAKGGDGEPPFYTARTESNALLRLSEVAIPTSARDIRGMVCSID